MGFTEQQPEEEAFPVLALETVEPTHFGRGWISGIISCILGVSGLGAVLCLRFPSYLTLPDLNNTYVSLLPYVRGTVHLALIAAFLLGTLSVWLRRNKLMGMIGISSTLLAALLGGSQAEIHSTRDSILSLDWFVLNLIIYSAVYIPLERLFAKYVDQPTFRKEWRVDLSYFFVNSLIVQATSFLTLAPAMVFFNWARLSFFAENVSGLPLLVQLPLCLLAADFAQYWIHRAFHSVPFLWRFHAIHHSAEAMDWLAGSRLHLVDALVTRGLTYVPIYVLGFSQQTIVAYVVIVAIQATFIHANLKWEFSWIRKMIATPLYHHWHHAAELEAIDKNFSVHTTVWDWLFGTYYMPGRWPKKYGVFGERDVPTGMLQQTLYPFKKKRDD